MVLGPIIGRKSLFEKVVYGVTIGPACNEKSYGEDQSVLCLRITRKTSFGSSVLDIELSR